ncbi:MAG: hypothetical protein FJ303_03350 [Planctomycetes bacterium]|nr:hypothetical protein [Planctomycetota bacterium]
MPSQTPAPVPPASNPMAAFFGVTLAAVVLTAVTSYYYRTEPIERRGSDCYEQEDPPGDQLPKQWAKWDKPAVAIVLSGQMHGYYDPCGCTSPQHGGLTRRYNFIKSLKDKGWNAVGVDLGELASSKGICEQNLLKYDLSVKSLATMNYRAIGLGLDEMLLPLGNGLAQIWDKNKPHPRPISLSLDQTGPGQLYHGLNVRGYEIIDTTMPKIGVISMLGPDLRDEFKAQEKFRNNVEALPEALKEFAKAGVEVGIILHHEYPKIDKDKFPPGIAFNRKQEEDRRAQALECVKFCEAERKKNPKIPPIHVMMVLTHEPEPPSFMAALAPNVPTQVVEIGHKGKYVGLLGVYRDAKGIRLQYDIVLMSPEWEAPKGKEADNPVIGLVEKYNQELKRTDMLSKYQRQLHFNQIPPQNEGGLKATYVGSARCGECHTDAYNLWVKEAKDKKVAHGNATMTLEKLTNPSGRHFDPECMSCHTTGFKNPGGYLDFIPVNNVKRWPAKPGVAPTAEKIAGHNKNTRGVGCESCHGPGSLHVQMEIDETKGRDELYPLINPYRLSTEERKLEALVHAKKATADQVTEFNKLYEERTRRMGANMCSKCHDMENDVNFGTPGHEAGVKWRPLIHRMQRNNAGAAIVPPMQPAPAIEIIQDKK